MIAAMPFLGFPAIWKNVFFVIIGFSLFVSAFGYRVRKSDAIIMEQKEETSQYDYTDTATQTPILVQPADGEDIK